MDVQIMHSCGFLEKLPNKCLVAEGLFHRIRPEIDCQYFGSAILQAKVKGPTWVSRECGLNHEILVGLFQKVWGTSSKISSHWVPICFRNLRLGEKVGLGV